jgi:hypothetical protein
MKPMDASDLLAVETLLFTNRIRDAQQDNPYAHRELINWSAWSRHLVGFKPLMARPGWCRDYSSQDWNPNDEEVVSDEVNKRRAAETEVKAEGSSRPLYREIPAQNLDVFLHEKFEWRIRRCLSVAYVWWFPEHQYAMRASRPKDPIDRDEFLKLFASALRLIERSRD